VGGGGGGGGRSEFSDLVGESGRSVGARGIGNLTSGRPEKSTGPITIGDTGASARRPRWI